MKKVNFALAAAVLFCGSLGHSQSSYLTPVAQVSDATELNPFDPNIDSELKAMDAEYEAQTGRSAHLQEPDIGFVLAADSNCYRENCKIYIEVDRSEQRLHLFVDGVETNVWPVSTGRPGFGTPNMDTHPDGRIYDVHTSSKYPGFNNMPFAVFIRGGFAIHGAPGAERLGLGRVASHGCIRVQTENAQTINRLVRQYGVRNTWINVKG